MNIMLSGNYRTALLLWDLDVSPGIWWLRKEIFSRSIPSQENLRPVKKVALRRTWADMWAFISYKKNSVSAPILNTISTKYLLDQ
jgi:hypothetical protein